MVAITGGGVEGGGPGLVVRFLLIIWSFQPVHEFIYIVTISQFRRFQSHWIFVTDLKITLPKQIINKALA